MINILSAFFICYISYLHLNYMLTFTWLMQMLHSTSHIAPCGPTSELQLCWLISCVLHHRWTSESFRSCLFLTRWAGIQLCVCSWKERGRARWRLGALGRGVRLWPLMFWRCGRGFAVGCSSSMRGCVYCSWAGGGPSRILRLSLGYFRLSFIWHLVQLSLRPCRLYLGPHS